MCGLSELVTSCLTSSKSSRQKSYDDDDGVEIEIVGTLKKSKSKKTKVLCPAHANIKKENPNISPFLKSSQFTDVPPTIRFYTKGTKVRNLILFSFILNLTGHKTHKENSITINLVSQQSSSDCHASDTVS